MENKQEIQSKFLSATLKLVKFFRPKYYNKITWVLVITGIGLLSKNLIETLIEGLFEKVFNIPIADENAPIYGIVIIFLALVYNILGRYIESLKANPTHKSNETNIEFESDRNIFRKIRELLPSDGSMIEIRDHDYAGAFQRNKLDQLHNYLQESKTPEFCFNDVELENLKNIFSENLNKFTLKLAVSSFVIDNNPNWSRIPYRHEFKNPEDYDDAMKKINKYQDDAWRNYEDLIKMGRKKLGD